MFKKWQKSEFTALGILEKRGDRGFDDGWAWEDEAIDFVAELGREAGKEVVFRGIICGLKAISRWRRLRRGGLVVFAFAPRHIDWWRGDD